MLAPVKRESGEGPERSRRCDRGAVFPLFCMMGSREIFCCACTNISLIFGFCGDPHTPQKQKRVMSLEEVCLGMKNQAANSGKAKYCDDA